jgi:hypothetical protein
MVCPIKYVYVVVLLYVQLNMLCPKKLMLIVN